MKRTFNKDLFQTFDEKIAKTLMRFREFEPPEGYYLAFSGGKDSIVIKRLAEMASVNFDSHYSVTTIDPPELVRFIMERHPDVIFERPEQNFFKRMIKKGFPLRQSRWCCEEYKETGGSGRVVVTGVRAEESARRAKRKMIDVCWKDPTKRLLHVIIDWTEEEVWEFIKREELPYCSLYDEGFERIGCILCPLARQAGRVRELKKYPRIVRLWKKAFQELYEDRKKAGNKSVDRWKDGEDMFQWWFHKDVKERKKTCEQLSIFS